MHLTFYGAARTVTGSCFLVEAAGKRILVDCGMFQGGKELRLRNKEAFAFTPNSLDAVLLTHAHIDHSGLLPRLVRDGYRGPILATSATADLCRIMLPDSAHIQEMEAEWRNKKARRIEGEIEDPLYTMADAERTLPLLEPVEYGEEITLFSGLSVRFLDAGHILGSATIELWAEEEGRRTKLVFSGDLGQREAPIIRDPTIVEGADYVVIESTYGDRRHEDRQGRREALARIILAARASGGNLVIPAFAVGRTQELLYHIKSLMDEGAIPRVDVYIDSPMAVSATEIFRLHPGYYDAETQVMLEQEGSPFDFEGLHFVRTVQESQALNNMKGGAVIISASGMCEAGRILHHLKHNLWRPEAHLLFVGYQAAGTLGRRLLSGDDSVRVMGEEVVVRAAVHNIGSFSAHADRDELLEWLLAMKNRPRTVFLVHGEDEILSAWAETVERTVGVEAIIASPGATYALADRARLVVTAAAAPGDDLADLLREVDAALRGLRSRLPAGDVAKKRKACRILRRVIDDLSRVG